MIYLLFLFMTNTKFLIHVEKLRLDLFIQKDLQAFKCVILQR